VRCGAVRCGAVRCRCRGQEEQQQKQVRCGAVRCGAVRCRCRGQEEQQQKQKQKQKQLKSVQLAFTSSVELWRVGSCLVCERIVRAILNLF
jgi:hypothetical protein